MGSSKEYSLLNSAGIKIAEHELKDEEAKSLKRKIGQVSVDCPTSISVSRSTLKIVDVQSSCSSAPGARTLVITKVNDNCGSSFCWMYDSSASRAVVQIDVSSDGSKYEIFPSDDIYSEVTMTQEQSNVILNYAKSVSPSCPLRITYNSESGKITKAKIGCDPLAFLNTPNNQG